MSLGSANSELAAAAENLTNREEVVTRRWEFYAYAAGYDPESHEVLTDNVGADGVHGTGSYSNTVVVGDFLGAQMSAANELSLLGLIDHLQDGVVGVPYTTRSMVISALPNFSAGASGALPDGLGFDPLTGRVSGTPATPGIFVFTVSVWATNHPVVTKSYPVWIAGAGQVLPPHCAVDVSVSSANTGTATGSSIYTNGATATVIATPAAGYKLANWTEDGNLVSLAPSYTFTNIVNQSLVANFVPKTATDCSILVSASPSAAGTAGGAAVYTNGASVTVSASTNAGFAFLNWVDTGSGLTVSSNANYTFTAKTNLMLVANFISSAPPLAFGGHFFQVSGQPLAINVAALTSFDYSPNGFPITLSGVSATTANGLALTTNATQILVPMNSVADSFIYTITDGYGGAATGAGYVSIITNVTSLALSLDLQSRSGYAGTSFSGVPWYGYTAHRGTNATFSGTVRSWPVRAAADGSIHLWDDFTDLGGKPAQAFYRLSFP